MYYNESFIKNAPSYSPFANSGVIMGSMKGLIEMITYVIDNNSKYFLHVPHANNKYKFDDQFAYADYCLKVNPLAASISLTFEDLASKKQSKWPFVCVTLDGTVSYHCPDSTWGAMRAGYITVNKTTCGIERRWIQSHNHKKGTADMNYFHKQQMLSLDPLPAIYHGNGAGKAILLGSKNGLGIQSSECVMMMKRGINTTDYKSLAYFHRDYSSDLPFVTGNK